METTTQTKAELAAENEQLREDVRVLADEREVLETALQSLNDRVDRMAAAMEARQFEGDPHDPAPRVIYDPFDEQNPHAILKHPDGFVLSWKNPNYRAHRGWRGWVPVQHDDEIGMNLNQYLQDPPPRMEGMGAIDNYVRRGTDSILCRIPKEIWDERQNKRENKAAMRAGRSADVQPTGRSDVGFYGNVSSEKSGKHNTPLVPEGGSNAVRSRAAMFRSGEE